MTVTTRFAYRAARADGAFEHGVLAAESRDAAVRALAAQGLWAVDLNAARAGDELRSRLSIADLALGLRVLATLLESGLPVSKALSAMPELAPDAWTPALPGLARAVREGASFGAALERSGLAIPAVVLGIVRAGEAGSGLARAVRRSADLMDETATTRSAQGSAAVDTAQVYTLVNGPRTDTTKTKFWLDRFGAPRKIADALGQLTTLTRGDARWPALVTNMVAKNGLVTTAGYDDHGNFVADSVWNPLGDGKKAVSTYAWDKKWDFVTSVRVPSGLRDSIQYDQSNGNRLWEQDDRRVPSRVNYSYVTTGLADGLIASVKLPLVPASAFAYDSLGNLRSVTTPLGFVHWEPVSIVVHWDYRGMGYDQAFYGPTAPCDTTGTASKCITISWAASRVNVVQPEAGPGSQLPPQAMWGPWFGSLPLDQQDASGRLYMRNRSYDPITTRFTQEDPIGLAGGLNAYGYAKGDPIRYSDPFGLCAAKDRGNCTQADVGPRDVAQSRALAVAGLTAISNPIPETFARVVPGEMDAPLTTLGKVGEADVFVTDANVLRGLSAKDIPGLLRIPADATGYRVIEFPSSSAENIASPVFRANEGFVGGGRTAGGAPEWVIKNGQIPEDAWIRPIGPDLGPIETAPEPFIDIFP